MHTNLFTVCTSHWFEKFSYIDSFIVSLVIEIEMHKKMHFYYFFVIV
jgi:hypothetical protein